MSQVVSLGKMVVQLILPYVIKNVPISGTLWISSYIHHTTLEREYKGLEMEDHIGNHQEVLKLLKDNLVMAQNRMKQQVD
jgi:hypothetical protein